tara:strand:+ start:45 stop:590 length:546 start_codon:yes stop_codon:yes gene_type:complete
MPVYNKTYLNLINTLRNLGRNHHFINTTTVGDIFDVDLSKETIFPLMHINPTSVTTGAAQLNYNFQIFVCDLVSEKKNWEESSFAYSVTSKNLSNEIDVFNDTLQTCLDIVSIFRNSKWQASGSPTDINAPEYFTEGEFSFEPFTERFDNLLTGWVFQMNIVVHNDFSSCDTPMNNISINN